MALAQIVLIWGAASAALFPFVSVAGEWENYAVLKDAIVHSSARRDVPLPAWAHGLEYKRPYYFWDVQVKKPEPTVRNDEKSNSVPAVPVVQR